MKKMKGPESKLKTYLPKLKNKTITIKKPSGRKNYVLENLPSM